MGMWGTMSIVKVIVEVRVLGGEWVNLVCACEESDG